MAVFVQAGTDCSYTSVHHIRWSHHICPRLHMGKGCFCQKIQSFVIVHIMSAQHAAVTVGSILTHTDICHIVKIRELFFCFTQSFLYDSVSRIGAASHFILMIRDSKQHDTAHSCLCKLLQLIGKAVNTVSELTFHRRDFLLNIRSFHHKKRVDQRRFIHSCLPHHFAQCLAAS